MRAAAVLVASAALLAACATAAPPDPALLASAQRDVTCQTGPDCDAKWSRALSWVIANSAWRLQIQSERLIRTAGPYDSVSAAFTIVREDLGDGRQRIRFGASCGNMFGCVPSVLQLQASFNTYVLGPDA